MTARISETPHPGVFIREELEERGWSQRDLAFVLGVPEQAVGLILSGRRGISPDMAMALGDAFDVSPEFFANLQKSYDMSHARVPDPAVKRRGRLQASYPVREMIKRGWFVESDAQMLEQQMARFFEVETPEDIPHVPPHAAKKQDYESVPPAQLAWLFRIRQLAKEMVVQRHSAKALHAAVEKLHGLMIAPDEARHVPRTLAECGVRFVIVEGLPGSKIDGVCFWLDDGSPVIGLSLRYDRIENFWFVLRHAMEHVLRRHGLEKPIIDSELEGERAGVGSGLPEEERQANAAASEFCVPSKELDSFVARKSPFFSERDLLGFAERLGVHPGIAAGQLRRRVDNWKLFTKHLVKIRASVSSAAVVDGWGEVAPVSL